MKRVFWSIAIAALILTVMLISLRAYYVLVALIAGALLICYRELWHLIKTKKLPPVDERVTENVGKSLRNGFIFFTTATAYLMLFFSINQSANPDMLYHPLDWVAR